MSSEPTRLSEPDAARPGAEPGALTALRAWLRRLLDPHPPGAGPHAPRVKLVALALMLGLLALQVKARYHWGLLPGKEWQAVHILLGTAAVLAVFALFHGVAALRAVTRRTWFVLGSGFALFMLFWTFGRVDSWGTYFAPAVADPTDRWAPLYGFMYFASSAVLFRLALPFLAVRALFGVRPGHFGLRAATNPHPPTVRRVWVVYLLLFLGVLPFVFKVSLTAAFQAKYPLAREIVGPGGVIPLDEFLVYQAFYVLVFVSGEAFWRGFLAFGTERDFGHYGLVLMLVPYVTGHFGKPYPETLGAIAAGLTLGFLALKHRSVWLGVALHYAVALSMDLLSIRANGFTFATP